MKLSTLLYVFLLPLALAIPAAQDGGDETSADVPASEGDGPDPSGGDGDGDSLSGAAARRITCTAKANVNCRSCPRTTCPGKFGINTHMAYGSDY